MKISNEVLTLITCWQIRLTDGTIMGFTEGDKDLVIDDLIYHASSGFTRSAVESTASLTTDNLEVEGIIDHALIKHEDLQIGRFDHAEVSIFLCDYLNPNAGKIGLRTGTLGEITMQGDNFVAEIRGLLQAFSQTIGELYSPQCRAELGDKRCKFAIEASRYEGKVCRVISGDEFIDDSIARPTGYYKYGKLKFSSGANKGSEVCVLEQIASKLIVSEAPPTPIRPHDRFVLYPGCDKDIATCSAKFNNAINFRGEPFIPLHLA